MASARAIADRLHSGAIHLLRSVRRADAESGLSPARLSALSVLVFGGPRTLGQLADAEQVRAPTMSVLSRELERGGLVRRTPDPRDARRVLLHPTRKGRRLMERARARRLDDLAARLRSLDADERACLDRAGRLLTRISSPG